ncbi:MAG: hypothetical protein ACYC7E_10685 [Armatimonadota bacterium]
MKRMMMSLLAFVLLCGIAWADNPDPIALIGTPEDGLDVEQTIDIEGVAGPSRDSTTVTWVLEYGEGQSPTTWTQLATGNTIVGYPRTWQNPDPENSDYGLFYSWDTTTKDDGFYTVRLTVTDGANKTATDQATYYFDNLHAYGSEDEEPGDFLLDLGDQTADEEMVTTDGLDGWQHGPTAPPNGPQGAPMYGTYTYKTPSTWYGRQMRAITTSWRVTNGTIVARGNTWVRVKWDVASRVDGRISYVTKGHKRSYARTVGIWEISTPSSSYGTPGTIAPDGEEVDSHGRFCVWAKSNVGGATFEASALVEANGPPSGTGMSALLSGYVQNVDTPTRNGRYLPALTTDTHPEQGTTGALDSGKDDAPFYFRSTPYISTFTAITTTKGQATISISDSPTTRWAKYYPAGDLDHRLRYPNLEMNFKTWIVAATVDQSHLSYHFARAREIKWDLDMSGEYNGTTYIPSNVRATVRAPGWSSATSATTYTAPYSEDIAKQAWP